MIESKHGNPCHMCDHRGFATHEGHCYMFKEEPATRCHQYRHDTDWDYEQRITIEVGVDGG